MEVSKVHVFFGLLLVGFFAASMTAPPARYGKEQLAAGRETTEELANLCKVKPMKPLAYLHRTVADESKML